MKLENKKYLVYGGLAVIVGSIGYIAYSLIFVKKPKTDDSVTVETQKETPTQTNPFKDMLDNPILPPSIDYKFNPINFGYDPSKLIF